MSIRLDNVFSLFESALFVPDKFYFLVEGNLDTKTSTSFYMEKDYEKEIKGKFNIEYVPVTSVLDLKDKLIKLNQASRQGVIVVIAQSLFDTEELKFVDKEVISRIIVKYNKKHLELGANPLFTEERIGLSICCAPSFEMMGKMLGKLFSESIKGKFQYGAYPSTNIVWVNKQRLEYLDLSKLYSSAPSLINNTIYSYRTDP